MRVVWQRSRVISTLLPALTGSHGDPPGAVRIGSAALSFAQLSTAAGAVAERIAGAGTVAVVATPTFETVVAIVGGLVAGVPVVPVPPDSGPVERAHMRGRRCCSRRPARRHWTGWSCPPCRSASRTAPGRYSPNRPRTPRRR